MEWRLRTSWWILFYIRYSRLFWIHHQGAWNNDWQATNSNIFVLNKAFDQLLNISPTNHIYTETFRSELSYIEVWILDFFLDYGFFSLRKRCAKSISSKYGLKLIDITKKSATDTLETASKKAIQKTAEATENLIGNKIAEKITKVASTREDQKNSTQPTGISKERYIPPEKRQQIMMNFDYNYEYIAKMEY